MYPIRLSFSSMVGVLRVNHRAGGYYLATKSNMLIPAHQTINISLKIKSNVELTSPCALFSESVIERYHPHVLEGQGGIYYIKSRTGHYIQLPIKNKSAKDIMLSPITGLYLLKFIYDKNNYLIPDQELIIK